MTYRKMLEEMKKLTDEQLDCDVTIELEHADECIAAEFRICNENHFALDDSHPVIFTNLA